MENAKYILGKVPKQWNENAQSLTFIVTEDCNLRCKYCYITHKASNKKLDLETAKKFIDLVLSGEIRTTEAVVLDFIGGEPLIEVDLIDKICDYFKLQTFEKNHSWYWNYRINMATNGVNYSEDKVQKFIQKNSGKISIGISVDGTKEKHDSQRVFPDGSGSYDIIKKSIPLWISQFGGQTKATFSSNDLKYLKDSVIDLWSNGITVVPANVIFENVWNDGDDLILEQQLKQLADYAIENGDYAKYICTFFDESIGGYYDSGDLELTTCGAGKMLALGPNGNLYPCMRYKDYSLNNKEEWVIGTVDNGIDMEKVRPFMTASLNLQSDNECVNCEIASGCMHCQGFNYDEAETATNFSRAKYICKMHKARVRANDYYFSKLFNLYGIEREGRGKERKKLYFLLSDDYITFCQNENTSIASHKMNLDNIIEGLNYARQNFFESVFVHSANTFNFNENKELLNYRIHHIVPAKFFIEASKLKDYILVFGKDDLNLPVINQNVCQLNIDSHDIKNLYTYVNSLFKIANRVNINIANLDKNFNFDTYEKQLNKIKDYLIFTLDNEGKKYTINIFDEVLINNELKGCRAGERSLALAPDGQLYVCAAYYSSHPEQIIGDIKGGLINLKNRHLYTKKYMPLCNYCNAYQCVNCIYLNQKSTKEVNVSPSFQCKKSNIEANIAKQYQSHYLNTAQDEEYIIDPISTLLNRKNIAIGYYKY